MNQLATVRSLQQRISEMQPQRLGQAGLPIAPALRPLLAGGVLRKGAAITVRGSLQLSLALLSEASLQGMWCGIIGVPDLGLEAASQLDLTLDRLVLVPDPGTHALNITGMLSEVLTVLVLRPAQQPTPTEVERLSARLRENGSSLIIMGDWPRCDAALHVTNARWAGLGRGHGMLEDRELTIRSIDRRGRRNHTICFHQGRLTTSAHVRAPAAATHRTAMNGSSP